MGTEDPAAVADVLAKRRDLLAALRDGPARKRALVERLDIPRTTLDRGVRELTDAGLVERVDGGLRATGVGREALAAHDEYHGRLDGVLRARPLFEPLDPDAPLDRRFLAGAEISRPDPSAPDRVVDRLFESVRDAGTVRGIAPVALAGHLETFDRAATAGGAVPELVVTPDVFDHLVEVRGRRLRESVAAGDTAVYRARVDVPFGVWIAEGGAEDGGAADGGDGAGGSDRAGGGDGTDAEAGVVVYTETGVGGVAVNDTARAVSWARERYAEARRGAERITADAVDEHLGGDRGDGGAGE
ncbi:helix-turn-helix transcriptional regulator [Halobaculum sp. EA56]|uniref:helix-turn-helix transcriptional regulator n=1 Tax=Halobaculum sp. EA56 TaxID=3421648 RepID=UPI003EBBCE56